MFIKSDVRVRRVQALAPPPQVRRVERDDREMVVLRVMVEIGLGQQHVHQADTGFVDPRDEQAEAGEADAKR